MSKNVIICLSCCWMGHLRECSQTLTHTSHSLIYQESVFMTDIWMYSTCEWTNQKCYFDLVFIVFRFFFSLGFSPFFCFWNWLLCLKIHKNEIFQSGFIRRFFSVYLFSKVLNKYYLQWKFLSTNINDQKKVSCDCLHCVCNTPIPENSLLLLSDCIVDLLVIWYK